MRANVQPWQMRTWKRKPGEKQHRATPAMGNTEVGGLEYQGLAAALKPPLYGMEAIMSGEAYEEGMMAGCAQEVDDADMEELQQQQQQARRRQDMLSRLRCCPDHPRQHAFERRLRGAEKVAELLRQRVTLPREIEEEGNWQHEAVLLPQMSCAFKTCPEPCASEVSGMDFGERQLREHILVHHSKDILDAAGDTYREALAVQERKNVSAAGPCVDRGAFEATLAVYNDEKIQALICMCCARICLQTAGPRSSIDYKKGSWFLRLPAGPVQVQG